MIVYLNQNFIDEKNASISIGDPGFLFGEGIFTTLRLYKGFAPDLEGHWLRLKGQAACLGITFHLTLEETRNIIHELVVQNRFEDCDARVRITITPGAIVPLQGDTSPTVLVTITPLPASFDLEIEKGVPVVILGPRYLRNHSPQLKSLNYLPSRLALREAHKRNCTEAIVLDSHGNITEGAISNVFLVKDGDLFTPQDNGQILAGLTRQHIIELASLNSVPCHEVILGGADLHTADEVFLCNSIRRIVPVLQIDEQQVGSGMPGPVTQKFSHLYDALMANIK